MYLYQYSDISSITWPACTFISRFSYNSNIMSSSSADNTWLHLHERPCQSLSEKPGRVETQLQRQGGNRGPRALIFHSPKLDIWQVLVQIFCTTRSLHAGGKHTDMNAFIDSDVGFFAKRVRSTVICLVPSQILPTTSAGSSREAMA